MKRGKYQESRELQGLYLKDSLGRSYCWCACCFIRIRTRLIHSKKDDFSEKVQARVDTWCCYTGLVRHSPSTMDTSAFASPHAHVMSEHMLQPGSVQLGINRVADGQSIRNLPFSDGARCFYPK
jgi:hypothetical protein